MKVNWFEFKYLDKSTNHSTQTEIIKYFKQQGVSIKYHCSFKKDKKYFGLSNEDIDYIDVPKVRFVRGILILLTMLMRNLRMYFSKEKSVQIIDYVCLYALLPVLIINKLFKRQTYVMDIRTYPVGDIYKELPFHFRFAHTLACYFCDGITYITEVMYQDSRQWSNSTVKQFATWGSGYNPSIFSNKNIKAVADNEKISLLYHGGISISRGILDLVKAVEICIKNGHQVKLTLLGVWVDKLEIQNFIKNRGLCEYITCLDPVPIEDIPRYIEDSDFGVLPFPDFIGWRVSSPIKLFEYLGMGTPVIVTNIECFSTEIGNKGYAIYAENSTPESLAEAIVSAIKNKQLFKAEGSKAIPEAQENYTWEAQADKFLRFIKKVVRNA